MTHPTVAPVSDGVKASVCVQHHPKRAHLLPQLVARLGADTEIVTDPDPDSPIRSPLRCYVHCLKTTPEWATHRVIVQDDALPADGFREKLQALVAEEPDALVPLFAPGMSPWIGMAHEARKLGQRFVRIYNPPMVPTVALVWPVALVAPFVEYIEEKISGTTRPLTGDDGRVGKWALITKTKVMVPFPSIVQHPDVEPSLIRRPNQGGRMRSRVAAWYEET